MCDLSALKGERPDLMRPQYTRIESTTGKIKILNMMAT